ncbi:MAG TPA: manganese efflux pump [Streptosporangiaceae bacterium]|nr:manganese efflux pump [Streptosporangiaceae bacterium]
MLALILVAASVGVSNLAASIGIGAGGVTMATRVRVLLTFGLFEAAMPIVGLLIGHDLASDIGREARLLGALLLGGVGAYGVARFALARIRSQQRSEPERSAGPLAEAGAGAGAETGAGAAGGAGQAVAEEAVAVEAARRGGRVEGGGAGGPETASDTGDDTSRQQVHQWIKIGVSAFALSLDNLIAGFALGSYQMNLITGALVFGFVSIGMSLAGLELGAKLGNWAGDGGELIGGVVLVGVGVAIGTGVLG